MYLALEYIFYCYNDLLIKMCSFLRMQVIGEEEDGSEFKSPVPHRAGE